MPIDNEQSEDTNTESLDQPMRPQQYEPVDLMSVEEVAAKLKVCKATVYKMVRKGQIEAVHLGRLVRITPEGYKQLLDKRSQGVK